MSEKYFEAGNLYLATYLLFLKFPVRGISGSGKNKRILFDDSLDIKKARDKFYADSETQELFSCYRRAKDYLFQNGV